MLADTLAVDWEWAALAFLAIAGSLIPQDRLETAPSISLPSSMWILLLHPGATNSSGVIGVVTKGINKLLEKLHRHESDAARSAWDALPEGERPEKYERPPRRQVLAGGGSLAANGIQASQGQNRDAILSAECEIEGVLSWFSNEMGVDKGAPGKLWDGEVWHRPAMDKSRAFSVLSPWFGIIAGGHVPEMFKATQADSFGLRERLTVSFAEPQWKTMRELRAACAKLPVESQRPQDFVASLFFPVAAWSVGRKRPDVFKPSTDDGAQTMMDEKFDAHMDMQKQCFLQPGQHERAKYHGKLRTKFDRMVLAMHVLHVVCSGWKQAAGDAAVAVDAWMDNDWCPQLEVGTTVPKQVVAMAYILAEHCECTWRILDFARSTHRLIPESSLGAPSQLLDAEGAAQPACALVLRDVADDDQSLATDILDRVGALMKDKVSFPKSALETVIYAPHGVFAAVVSKLPHDGCTKGVLLNLMRVVVQATGRWFNYSKTSGGKKHLHKATHGACEDCTMFWTLMACKVLEAVGIGKVVMTVKVAGGGCYNWYFIKRIPTGAMHLVLASMGVGDHTTPDIDAYAASIAADDVDPPRCPQDIQWDQHTSPAERLIINGLGLDAPAVVPDELGAEAMQDEEVASGGLEPALAPGTAAAGQHERGDDEAIGDLAEDGGFGEAPQA